MKKTIIALCLLFGSSPAHATDYVMSHASGVFIREQPQAGAKPLTKLNVGSVAEKVPTPTPVADWVQVYGPKQKKGWIAASLVDPFDPNQRATAYLNLVRGRTAQLNTLGINEITDLLDFLARADLELPNDDTAAAIAMQRYDLAQRALTMAPAGTAAVVDVWRTAYKTMGAPLTWTLQERFASTAAAEPLAYRAVTQPQGRDVSHAPCAALVRMCSNVNRYLQKFPQGPHAAELIQGVTPLIAGCPASTAKAGWLSVRAAVVALRDTVARGQGNAEFLAAANALAKTPADSGAVYAAIDARIAQGLKKPAVGTTQSMPMDVDGDGIDDLVFAGQDGDTLVIGHAWTPMVDANDLVAVSLPLHTVDGSGLCGSNVNLHRAIYPATELRNFDWSKGDCRMSFTGTCKERVASRMAIDDDAVVAPLYQRRDGVRLDFDTCPAVQTSTADWQNLRSTGAVPLLSAPTIVHVLNGKAYAWLPSIPQQPAEGFSNTPMADATPLYAKKVAAKDWPRGVSKNQSITVHWDGGQQAACKIADVAMLSVGASDGNDGPFQCDSGHTVAELQCETAPPKDGFGSAVSQGVRHSLFKEDAAVVSPDLLKKMQAAVKTSKAFKEVQGSLQHRAHEEHMPMQALEWAPKGFRLGDRQFAVLSVTLRNTDQEGMCGEPGFVETRRALFSINGQDVKLQSVIEAAGDIDSVMLYGPNDTVGTVWHDTHPGLMNYDQVRRADGEEVLTVPLSSGCTCPC